MCDLDNAQLHMFLYHQGYRPGAARARGDGRSGQRAGLRLRKGGVMAIGVGQALTGDGETRAPRAATDAVRTAAPMQMSCRFSADGRAVIALRGELDLATVDRVVRYVSDVIDRHDGPVSADLHGVAFCDGPPARAAPAVPSPHQDHADHRRRPAAGRARPGRLSAGSPSVPHPPPLPPSLPLRLARLVPARCRIRPQLACTRCPLDARRGP
jgi:hypothetical protein